METRTHFLPYPVPGPGWQAGITELVVQTTAAIARGNGADLPPRTVLVLHGQPGSPTPPQIRLSAKEALRSLIHASTLENPPQGVCLVLAASADDTDLESTLNYLSGPYGEFLHGTTIDLLGAP
jgi:hypothetical protein